MQFALVGRKYFLVTKRIHAYIVSRRTGIGITAATLLYEGFIIDRYKELTIQDLSIEYVSIIDS